MAAYFQGCGLSLRHPRKGARRNRRTRARLVHHARRLRARAENAGCELEPVVQRNPLVEQERRGVPVALRGVDAPALLLPANERRARLCHEASLADIRHRRPDRVMRHAVVVSGP